MSKHSFKKKHVDPDSEPEKSPVDDLESLKQRLSSFEWDDSDEEQDDLPVFEASDQEVDDCARSILVFLSENLSFEDFDPAGKDGAIFTVRVDTVIHRLLRVRFANEWNLNSRIDLFDSIRCGVSNRFADSENRQPLLDKVQQILPASHRKKFSITDVLLHDDALTVEGGSDAIVAEISLKFQGI